MKNVLVIDDHPNMLHQLLRARIIGNKMADWVEIKERQKRPVRVSFLLRHIIITCMIAKAPMNMTVNRVGH